MKFFIAGVYNSIFLQFLMCEDISLIQTPYVPCVKSKPVFVTLHKES
jgi:hypothetical protein